MKINWIRNAIVENRRLPDIYLIILDGYTSSEVLKDLYEFDNDWFELSLNNLGFTVVNNAKANYSQTRTVISSMLNMEYLDEEVKMVGSDSINAIPFKEMINNNYVVSILKDNGYRIYSYQSGYSYTDQLLCDRRVIARPLLSEFEISLLTKTLAYPFIHDMMYSNHRELVLGNLENISHNSSHNYPTFHFLHLLSPHPPFVFDNNGLFITPYYPFSKYDADNLISFTSKSYYRNSYPEQLEYISKLTLDVIRDILSTNERDPIIILMGDHGPGLSVSQNIIEDSNHYERLHILDALYLPEVDPNKISGDYTPVNTFRIIFNEYFGYDFEMLENRSYVSSYDYPFDFIDVTNISNINTYIDN